MADFSNLWNNTIIFFKSNIFVVGVDGIVKIILIFKIYLFTLIQLKLLKLYNKNEIILDLRTCINSGYCLKISERFFFC